MKTASRALFMLAVLTTLVAGSVWLATGRHYYTKFEVVETIEVPLDEDDPLAGAGFYDGDVMETTVTRDEFHLGVLPTPSSLFDKHALSLATLVGPPWLLAAAVGLWARRRRSVGRVHAASRSHGAIS